MTRVNSQLNYLYDIRDFSFRGLRLGQNFQGRRLREQAGLSLRQMARLLEIQPGSLSRWERGINTPHLEDAIKWAQACNKLEDIMIQQNAVSSINEHVKNDKWFTDSYRDLIQKALQAYLVSQSQLEGTQGQIAVDRLRAAGAWDNSSEGR